MALASTRTVIQISAFVVAFAACAHPQVPAGKDVADELAVVAILHRVSVYDRPETTGFCIEPVNNVDDMQALVERLRREGVNAEVSDQCLVDDRSRFVNEPERAASYVHVWDARATDSAAVLRLRSGTKSGDCACTWTVHLSRAADSWRVVDFENDLCF